MQSDHQPFAGVPGPQCLAVKPRRVFLRVGGGVRTGVVVGVQYQAGGRLGLGEARMEPRAMVRLSYTGSFKAGAKAVFGVTVRFWVRILAWVGIKFRAGEGLGCG